MSGGRSAGPSGRVRAFGAWQLVWLLSIGGFVGLLVYVYRRPLPAPEPTFLVWFLGFLLGVELLTPRHAAPDLWRKLRWIVVGGTLVVAFIAVRGVIEVLA